jgi:transcriptional repressor NrdR
LFGDDLKMKCRYCGYSHSKVIDSRVSGEVIRRRRKCLKCNERFTTYERVEQIPLMVIKKNNRREPFDRTKLMGGLMRAVIKREVPTEKLESIIDDIERELRSNFQQEVVSQDIGNMVLKRLKQIDKVAYIRFASVYKEFADVDEFNKELEKLR